MKKKGYTLEELSKLTGTLLVGDPQHEVTNVDGLESAGPHDVSFLSNARYQELLPQSLAGIICIDRNTKLQENRNFLISDDPSHTFQTIAELLLREHQERSGFTGIHPTAVVHDSAQIGNDVTLGPHVVVDQNAKIGDGTTISAGTFIGPGASVGKECYIHANVTVREGTLIGNRVILQPGSVIGSCGYGYLPNEKGHHQKLNQLGIVILEDDVEIGANTTIDRARFKATIIKRGAKIDNLVQIGHNVEIGEDNLIVAQTGIAGSSKTGRHVIIGGQCGITGHVEITSGAQIATRSGVSKKLTKPGAYRGSPVTDLNKYNKQKVLLRNIEKHVKKIKELESRIEQLES
ncbi:MAG: UDP-3-O-(3-hydroxymyristoyl)glucosamine N-acyltransferase [Candidatus Algichlamydia australiensis]|nr:UDP-3-O-(3-hydroxymyristoyl)glucosamine N-acyltransferase [Chlamydiales bacterium]